jgi:hypothetical protein
MTDFTAPLERPRLFQKHTDTSGCGIDQSCLRIFINITESKVTVDDANADKPTRRDRTPD